MKYEDRIQLQEWDLTEEFFDQIVAYGIERPSGLGGPGCVIMISEDGKSYQFHGEALDKLNYYTNWHELFPIIKQVDGIKWRIVTDALCTKLIIRGDIYDLYMDNRANLNEGRDYRWEDACIKAVLLHNAISEDEIEDINWKYELRRPIFRKGDLVFFDFDNGKRKIPCKGVVMGSDIYRVHGRIQQIEYDIHGNDYINFKKKCLYKHVDESCIEKAKGYMLVISSLYSRDSSDVIDKIINSAPDKYAVAVPATTKFQEVGEAAGKDYYYYSDTKFAEKVANHEFLEFNQYEGEFFGITQSTVYKNCFNGKNVFLDVLPVSLRQIKEKHPHIRSVYILPPSLDYILSQLSKGEEFGQKHKKCEVNAYLKSCLQALDFVSEYDFVFVSENSANLAFVIESLFYLMTKDVSSNIAGDMKVVEQLKKDIKKYLEDVGDE